MKLFWDEHEVGRPPRNYEDKSGSISCPVRWTRLVTSNLMRSHNPVGIQSGIYKRMEIFSVFGMNSLACQGFWSQTLRCPIPPPPRFPDWHEHSRSRRSRTHCTIRTRQDTEVAPGWCPELGDESPLSARCVSAHTWVGGCIGTIPEAAFLL